MIHRTSIAALLLGTAFAAHPAFAQTQPAGTPPPAVAAQTTPPAAAPAPPAPPGDAEDDSGDAPDPIVIVGSKPRGSVIGDIPPQNTLDSRDVRATGATSINELLDALAPQIGSAQGRGGERPVLLLNGQRISSFRELRDIPTEAIQRVEILPEEVALKYGYSATQKVVNIVLRPRFRSTAVTVGAGIATDGGYAKGNGDVTRLMIQKNGRTTINLHAEGNGMLTENERDILFQRPLGSGTGTSAGTDEQQLAARSLVGAKRDLRAATTFNRNVLGNVSATLNTEVEHSEGRSLIGLSGLVLEPLGRRTSTDTGHVGVALNWDKWDWRWSVTSNADIEHDITRTDRDDPTFPRARAFETLSSGDLLATANGTLFKLPGGNVSTTLKAGASTEHLRSSRFDAAGSSRTSLGRTTGTAAANIDIPVSHRGRGFSALGNLTVNANAEVKQLSDFGTLTTVGAGLNWSPLDRLNLIGSWTREQGAPTIQQLGDPVLTTSGTRIFDFTTGQTVLVQAVTGGNPALQADRRKVMKLSANWQPFADTDLRLRADYVHQTIDRPISSITVTEAIESAFPDRFVRDSSGRLVRVDLRPVNFDSSRRDTLRVGFDFSKPLKSRRPSQSVIDQFRAQWRGAGGPAPAGSSAASSPAGGAADRTGQRSPPSGNALPGSGGLAENTPPPASAPGGAGEGRGGEGRGGEFRGGGGWGGGGFGGRGGGTRGRLQFSLTDTITFVDKVTIAPGVPVLDYLHGGAAGQGGGTSRHAVEAQGGYFNNGLGARISAKWRSGTTVSSLNGDNLRFSPLATFDLRLFANPGDIPEVALKHPWLRGTQVRFEVDNIFNARPNVHDATGVVPISYQPELLDPLGRTVMISIRKLFLPSPAFFRQLRSRDQQSGTTSR